MIDFKKIAEFIEITIVGCKFVGMADDGELFIEFDHQDDSLKLNAAELLRSEFSEVAKVTFMEKVNIKQAKEMVDELNKLMEELDQKDKALLDIGTF